MQVLTLEEFCQSSKLSASTVRRYCKRGLIPFLQLGGRGAKLLFRADALEQVRGGATASAPPAREIPGPVPRWRRRANAAKGSAPA